MYYNERVTKTKLYGEAMFDDRELAEAMYQAYDEQTIKRGSDAFFVYLNDYFGVKSYYSRYTAEFNQNMQYLASLHGLAPRCLGTIHHLLSPNNGKEVFSFVTEVADTSYWENVPMYDKNDNKYFEQLPEIRALHKRLRDCGFKDAIGDLHAGNVGQYKGEVVCIDFSRMEAFGFRSRQMVR